MHNKLELESIDFLELIERMTDAFFAIDRDFRFIYINETGAALLLKKPHELIGKRITDHFPLELSKEFIVQYTKAMEEQRTVEFDAYYPEPLDRWYHVRAYPAKNGVSVFFKDSTEEIRKKTIKEEYYKSLFDQNPNGVFSMDKTGQITSINPGMELITGYDLEHYKDKKYFEPDIIHLEDIQYIKSCFETAISGKTKTYEMDLRHKEGHVIHCLITFFPIKVEGEVVGVYGLVRDITDIKEMEYNLRRSQERYKSLKLNNPDGICSFDLHGRLIGTNPAFQALTGYSQMELLESNLRDIFKEDDLKKLSDMFREEILIQKNEKIKPIEMPIKNKSGEIIFTLITIIPFYIEGKLEGFYLIVKDISKTKETEDLLIRTEKLSAVGQLAATIVHEIRNPLTSLMGFLQLLKYNNGKIEEYYDIMAEELMRISSITNELLVLSKPQSVTMNKENITEALRDVLKLMGSQATMNNVNLQLEFEEDLPDIFCDKQQMKQVFINIVKNGIEAMEQNGGNLIVRAKKCDSDRIIISFSDEGHGIANKQLENIGKPFFTTKKNGTGLGMLMTNNIIKNHNGELKIESKLGSGTTVHILLPINMKEKMN